MTFLMIEIVKNHKETQEKVIRDDISIDNTNEISKSLNIDTKALIQKAPEPSTLMSLRR